VSQPQIVLSVHLNTLESTGTAQPGGLGELKPQAPQFQEKKNIESSISELQDFEIF